jgi:hypothetical protein
MQHLPSLAPPAATAIRPLPLLLIPFHERSNMLPLKITQIDLTRAKRIP